MSIQKINLIETALCGPKGYFEIEEADVLGQKMPVFKNRAPSLRALLEASARFGEKEYIVYGDQRITYAQHLKAVCSMAMALKEKFHIKKGDRVAILASNRPEWIISFWATVSLGGIVVALNGWWVKDEIIYALKNSQPKVLIGDTKRLKRLEDVDIAIPIVEMETGFKELLDYNQATLSTETVHEDDPACIIYTSGTTGRARGAVQSHRSIIAVAGLQIFHAVRVMQVRGLAPAESPAALVTSPLFHVSGLHAGAVVALAAGIKTVWMGGRFDPVKARQLIQQEKITGWGPMNSIAYQFVNHSDVSQYTFSTLTSIGSGGMHMPDELQDSLRRVFPNASDSLALGYGLTECAGLATLNFGDEFKQKPSSAGRALPTIQIQIRDIEGMAVGEGIDGEIFVRGPVVMLKYWKLKKETTKIITQDRWLATGDFGKITDGYLVVNSRFRELIIRGSENIAPAEIEQRIAAHPDVAEVVVVGIEHKELGQEVKAIVVPKPGSLVSVEGLSLWTAEKLAYFKVPAHWEIRQEALPRNAVGKVMKHMLDESMQEIPFCEG